MNITKNYLENLAEQLFEKWDIDGWTFGWNNRKTSWGVCKYNKKRIELSEWVYKNTLESAHHEFVDTLKHEVAHILAGAQNGHNHIWKSWARRVGANPTRSTRFSPIDPNKGVKWLLIDTSDNDKVIKRYYRKPPARKMANIANYFRPGRPQSKGALKYKRA